MSILGHLLLIYFSVCIISCSITYYINELVNLNGIVGEFEQKNEYSGLNEMKLGFNSIVTEYVGEFDIVLNNFAYNLYKKINKSK